MLFSCPSFGERCELLTRFTQRDVRGPQYRKATRA